MSEAGSREPGLGDGEGRLDPAEAFSLIGNETRLAILEALWESSDRPVAFSELRRRVGVRDSAGFNYHLGKMAGQFVRKTDGGYDFKEAGRKVVSAVLAGSFTGYPALEPFEIDGTCAVCGARLRASYADERLSIECPACGKGHGEYPFPPGGFHDRTREEVMRAFAERVRHLHCLAADGVCPECSGRMEAEIREDPGTALGVEVGVRHRCQQCRHEIRSPVGLVLLDDAEVVTFYRDHGTDLTSEPYWDLPWCVTDEHTTVLSRDPWRVRIDVPLGGRELRVTIDGDLDVVEVRRRSRDGATDG